MSDKPRGSGKIQLRSSAMSVRMGVKAKASDATEGINEQNTGDPEGRIPMGAGAALKAALADASAGGGSTGAGAAAAGTEAAGAESIFRN